MAAGPAVPSPLSSSQLQTPLGCRQSPGCQQAQDGKSEVKVPRPRAGRTREDTAGAAEARGRACPTAPSAPPPGLQALPCPPPGHRPLCHRGRWGPRQDLAVGSGQEARGASGREGSLPTRSLPPPSLALEAAEWPGASQRPHRQPGGWGAL